MTTYTWTDDMMRSGSTCDVDKVADNLMHLKYDQSGGVCKFNSLGSASAASMTLTPNYITTADFVATTTTTSNSTTTTTSTTGTAITLPTVTDTTKQVTCILDFTTNNAGYPTISNTNIKWSNKNSGQAPSAYSVLAGVKNVLTFKSIFINGTLYWEAEYTSYGAVEKTFIQPTLSTNGVLGGNNFAVYASSELNSSTAAYKGADNNSTTNFTWNSTAVGNTYTWYNPSALNVSSIDITNVYNANMGDSVTGYTIFGSNDNSSWTTLFSGTNNSTSNLASWSIIIPLNNRNFYKYYKLYVSSQIAYGGFSQATLNATYVATN